MQIKRFAFAAALAAAAFAPAPAAADPCVDSAVNSCDRDFPKNDFYLISIRGWCYLVRVGMCKAGY